MKINNFYIKTIKEFIYDTDQTRIWKNIVCRLALSRGEKPSKAKAEHRSWINSLSILGKQFKKLNSNVIENTHIILEASFNDHCRIDASLVGTKNGKPRMILIENKQWTNPFSFIPYAYDELECVDDDEKAYVVKGEKFVHPSAQVGNYRSNLYDFNDYIQKNKVYIRTIVFLHNMYLKDFSQEKAKDNPFLNIRFEEIIKFNPIFVQGNSSLQCNDDNQFFINTKNVELCDYINGFFDGGNKSLVKDIFSSEVNESDDRIARLSTFWEDENFDEIRKMLNTEQLEIFNDIKNAVFENIKNNKVEQVKKRVFLIHGDPGTGKSILALALYIYFHVQVKKYMPKPRYNPNVKYIVNSPDVMKTLSLSFGINKNIFSYRFAPKKEQFFDLVICDESHRFEETISPNDKRKTIDTIIKHSGVCVFFYDYYQSVSLSDYLNSREVQTVANEYKAVFKPFGLSRIYRLKNGHHYSLALQNLLSNRLVTDEMVNDTIEEGYKAYIFKDVQQMFEIIKKINKIQSPVRSRMLSGRCSSLNSLGKYENWTYNYIDKKTHKVDRKPTIAPVRGNPNPIYSWNKLDEIYGKYNCFSIDNDSSSLVGCVQSIQGVSLRYAGVILGPDIYCKPGDSYPIKTKIEAHDSDDKFIQKYDEKTNKMVVPTNKEEKSAIHRCIMNAYRVLLTRAEEGCFVYCYDEALEKYLIDSKLFKYFDKNKFVMPKPKIANLRTRIRGIIQDKDKTDNLHRNIKFNIVDSSGNKYKIRAVDFEKFKAHYGDLEFIGLNVTFIKRTSTRLHYDYATDIMLDVYSK